MMKDLEEEQYGDGNSTLITLNISYRKQEIYIFYHGSMQRQPELLNQSS